jgi:hypothetical protein
LNGTILVMAKKRRGITPNLNLSSSKDTDISKLSKKEMGKAVSGNPDAWDKKNIESLIDSYEMAYPGRLRRMKEDVDVELALSGRTDKFGEISKLSEFRSTMWLPADLQEVLERSYPSLWTNKDHQVWFLQNWPIFKRAEKI